MNAQVLTEFVNARVIGHVQLPDEYVGLTDEEMDRRIAAAKAKLGSGLVILCHHYQRDEVFKFADYTGDSFKLSRLAAARHDADFIVFCGVHFMAESADILSAPHQQVILPDPAAGCSMADMASLEQVETCWRDLERIGLTGVVPVTYINSSAAVKAFCGEHGGLVCTSSNAAAALRWAWQRGERVLFIPDQHLGRNTAYKMGVPLEQMAVWDPEETGGGLEPDSIRAARILLWKGHCSVHMRFTTQHVEQFRRSHPDVRVIVHPECTFDVVQAADDCGSTEYIIKTVSSSPRGSVWAVGTEIHLVNRLARTLAPDRTVFVLEPFGCLCTTMFRISPNHLLWALEGLVEGRVYNPVVVPESDKHWARAALDRMLALQP